MINHYVVAAIAADRQKTFLAEAQAARVANLTGVSAGPLMRHLVRFDRWRHTRKSTAKRAISSV
jgi:hypothetical protein